MTVLVIALGAAIGAPLRYLVDRWVRRWHDTAFPWGTLAVNLTASLILGLLVGLGNHIGALTYALLGTGFCATLSTYSTFGYENQQLAAQRSWFYAVANVSLSIVAGVGAASLGWSIGAAF